MVFRPPHPLCGLAPRTSQAPDKTRGTGRGRSRELSGCRAEWAPRHPPGLSSWCQHSGDPPSGCLSPSFSMHRLEPTVGLSPCWGLGVGCPRPAISLTSRVLWCRVFITS